MNLNPVAFVTPPPVSLSVTPTLPAAWAGLVTFTFEPVIDGAMPAVDPNVTFSVVATRFEPLMSTDVPPAVGPKVGAIDVMVGVGGMNLNPVIAVTEPPESVTFTVTDPATCADVVTLIDSGVVEVTVPGAPPNVTFSVVEVKLKPEMVTDVPPEVAPWDGAIPVIFGAGGMNLNAFVTESEPPESLTLTATTPAPWGGDVTRI
jgi:hypothetical protein